MTAITPTPEQLENLTKNGPEGPLVMVNLLKYREKAAYDSDRPEAKESLSGREAYQRYGVAAIQHVTAIGGGIQWGGPQKLIVVGGPENDWDDVVCVRYPSRAAFLKMISDPDYLTSIYHRDAGLERTVLLCCDAGMAS